MYKETDKIHQLDWAIEMINSLTDYHRDDDGGGAYLTYMLL